MAEVSINGIAVDVGGFPTPEAAAAHELLRQRARAVGLITDSADAEAADAAIERLLEREVATPEPTEAECCQYYAANTKQFVSGELVAVRHILFQATPGTPINALRAKAELTLSELLKAPDRFAALAQECSNCPSGQQGGNLGQVQRGETVPEFERALFDDTWIGICSRLVRTRYGFHIVAVDRRVPGRQVPFEAARKSIAEQLRERGQKRALAQYVRVLAGQAAVRGVELGAVPTPLVQ